MHRAAQIHSLSHLRLVEKNQRVLALCAKHHCRRQFCNDDFSEADLKNVLITRENLRSHVFHECKIGGGRGVGGISSYWANGFSYWLACVLVKMFVFCRPGYIIYVDTAGVYILRRYIWCLDNLVHGYILCLGNWMSRLLHLVSIEYNVWTIWCLNISCV